MSGVLDTSRIDVRSADGTSIAVWVDGHGPPLVLAHGALNDHTTIRPLVEALRDGTTTFTMDRRGRGASGDTSPYAIEREFEDVAAVVDAIAVRTGGPVPLWGHSYGAGCAMGAAALTKNVHRLVLYEPGLGMTYPPGSIEAVEEHVAAGDPEAAAVALYLGIVEMTTDQVDAYRSSPSWPTRVAIVPTMPRELAAEAGWRYRPGQFDSVEAPTLVLAGSESPPAQQEATQRAAAAIAGARIQVLDGHGHAAHQTDPAVVAELVRRFVEA